MYGNRAITTRQDPRHKFVETAKPCKVIECGMQCEISETFPKVFPTCRQNAGLNSRFNVHKFHYMQKNTVRQATDPVHFIIFSTSYTFPLSSLHLQLPLSFFFPFNDNHLSWGFNCIANSPSFTLTRSPGFGLWNETQLMILHNLQKLR